MLDSIVNRYDVLANLSKRPVGFQRNGRVKRNMRDSIGQHCFYGYFNKNKAGGFSK